MRHFEELLDDLQRQLLEMAALVESTIHSGVTAAVERSAPDARTVLSQQPRINEQEIEIDEFVTRLLALHQPVAKDLRLITTALKINSDLKRMGELAVNIARRSISLSEKPPVRLPGDLIDIGHRVQSMVSKSLQAFAQRQESLAAEVLAADDEVDQLALAMSAVRHRDARPTGFQHPTQLPHRGSTIGDVVEHVRSEDHIERLAVERQSLCVSADERRTA